MAEQGATIIKRKKVVQGGGHHGGAWKVAYADFVTAMMAFFLLLWLLNATTEEQRQGIADYFAPAIPIHRQGGGGDGAFGGNTIYAEDKLVRNGTGAERMFTSDGDQSRGDTGHAPEIADEAFEERDAELISDLLRAASGEVLEADDLMNHIETRLSDDGLIIELFERDGAAIFRAGSAEPEPRLTAMLQIVGRVLRLVSNDLTVAGHTDGAAFVGTDYTNWELSADRAHATRRALIGEGVSEARFARVTGAADRDPIVQDPFDSRNRRVVITVLRSSNTLN